MKVIEISKECYLVTILLDPVPLEKKVRHPIFGTFINGLGYDEYLLNYIGLKNNEETTTFYKRLKEGVIYRFHFCTEKFRHQMESWPLKISADNDGQELCAIETKNSKVNCFILHQKHCPISLRNFAKMAIMKAPFPKEYVFNELAGNVEQKDLWGCTLSKIELRKRFTFTPDPQDTFLRSTCFSCHIEDCKAVPKDEDWIPFD